MIGLAWRNLVREKTRLAISAVGVALALVLILVIAGIFAGSEEFAIAYIKNEPAPIWLMQAGVENMHMSSSYLAPQTAAMVSQVAGVRDATGVLYVGANLDVGDDSIIGYFIGVDPDAPIGGPWQLVEGSQRLARGDIIVDYVLAQRYGLKVGDTVSMFGSNLTIAGLSRGNFGIGSSFAFVNKETLAALASAPPDSASFVLVRPQDGVDPKVLAERLQTEVPGIHVELQSAFAESDRELIRQMGEDIIRAMNIIAYIVGLLVIAFTIYTATLERAREYGMLKALGASFPKLAIVVLAQSFISSALGTILGIGAAFGVAALVTRVSPDMLVLIEPANVIRQLPTLALVTALASLLPMIRIASQDAMIVFKA
jgi:putative ABC transport system permease protein